MISARFETKCRTFVPAAHPYWVVQDDHTVTVRGYFTDEQELHELWSDAWMVRDVQQEQRYSFTDRYYKPEWFPLKVVSVAMQTVDGVIHTLPPPARHRDLVQRCVEELGYKKPCSGISQGFMVSSGQYVNREIARKIAEVAGQLLPSAQEHTLLFSEHVW